MEFLILKCFVCNINVDSINRFQSTEFSKYSHTPMYKLLEKCLKQTIINPNEECICKDCIKKLNNFDYSILSARRIEAELYDLYQKKTIYGYTDVAVEDTNYRYYDIEHLIDEIDELIGPDDNDFNCDVKAEFLDDNAEISYPEEFVQDFVTTAKAESESEEEEEEEEEEKENREVEEHKEKFESSLVAKRTRDRPKQSVVKSLRESRTSAETKRKNDTPSNKLEKSSTLSCSRCNLTFANKTRRREHVKLCKQQLLCHICGKMYKKRGLLKIHVGLHEGISPNEVCGKKFTPSTELARHMPSHTGEKLYECDKCGKHFICYTLFRAHKCAHDNARNKKCEKCRLELRSNLHLCFHGGEKPFACPICDKKFSQKYGMTQHYKSHQGIHRVHHKNHVCPICNEVFTRHDKLKTHLTNQHGSANGSLSPANNLLNEKQSKATESVHYSIVVGNEKKTRSSNLNNLSSRGTIS